MTHDCDIKPHQLERSYALTAACFLRMSFVKRKLLFLYVFLAFLPLALKWKDITGGKVGIWECCKMKLSLAAFAPRSVCPECFLIDFAFFDSMKNYA